MPLDATVNALRGAPPTAGFTPGGGTSVVMPGPRNAATVKALRTRQPPTSTPGPGLQRPDNTALFAEQESWQERQNAAQAPRPPTPPAPGSTGTPTLIDVIRNVIQKQQGGTPTPEPYFDKEAGLLQGEQYTPTPEPYFDKEAGLPLLQGEQYTPAPNEAYFDKEAGLQPYPVPVAPPPVAPAPVAPAPVAPAPVSPPLLQGEQYSVPQGPGYYDTETGQWIPQQQDPYFDSWG